MTIHAKLSEIQRNLHAPKTQRNKFGNYDYRSCEDILQAVKPLLGDCSLVITDDIFSCSDRVYIKATATLSDGKETVSSTAFAREPIEKKGMDVSQISGAASSYSRKYALNGLLLIDDSKDADSMDNSKPKVESEGDILLKVTESFKKAEDLVSNSASIKDLDENYEKAKAYYEKYSERFMAVETFLKLLCTIKSTKEFELDGQ